MKKIETIWHYLLNQAIDNGEFQHTQAGLAEQFHFSTSTINFALVKPTTIGAVRKSGKFFVVSDPLKFLYLAATFRDLPHDTLYQTNSSLPITQLEGVAPAEIVYGGYTAAKYILGEPPSDYNTLYLYATPHQLPSLKLRYPPTDTGKAKIIILGMPPHLPLKNHSPLSLTFVDIWQNSAWQYKEFCDELEKLILLKLTPFNNHGFSIKKSLRTVIT